MGDVSSIETENRMVYVYTREGHFLLDRSLEELECLLAPRFLRVHRSTIINLSCIKTLLPDPGHSSRLTLVDGRQILVSRDRLAQLRKALMMN